MTRRFGAIPGVRPGDVYPDRRAAFDANVHRQLQAGISGTAREGAESIVLNGGYKDDIDRGDEIIYTGHGGQDSRNNQVSDQSFDDPGNAALVVSKLEQILVRVLRGPKGDKNQSPTSGYRYDGLFTVDDFWMADGLDGFKVCRFLLVKVQEDDEGRLLLTHEPAEEEPIIDESETGPAPRIANTGSRTVRKSAVVDQVKIWYSNSCQVCGRTLKVAGGNSYSQGAHIRGLGRPHDGPDITSNVLCLCPNDHILFDNGALYLTDDLKVVDALEGATLGELRVDSRHRINLDHVRYHRSLWGAGY